LLEAARVHNVEVLLPLLSIPEDAAKLKTVGWIPDFQHVHLPDYFSEAERRARDLRFRLLAERASLVMLTSQDAREDFVAFTPEHAHKARVVSFPAFLTTKTIANDPHVTVKNFNLPEKFALVANQFWRHKNHQVVVEAIAELRRRNLRIPVVMTGLPADYRDPINEVLSQMLQAIARAGLVDQVVLLGLVSDEELLALMRAATLVIQPSRFEGWSTIVQNTKALGRPLICSDIAAHREQAPDALGFFPCDRADALAEILATYWPRLECGPNPEAECKALAAEQEAVKQYGHSILKLCLEAFNL
jgi:glycosyltransferase involved in cell wall biosynthesis